MTTPLEKKLLIYLGIILIVLIIQVSLVYQGERDMVASGERSEVANLAAAVAVVGILGASALLVLTAGRMRRETAGQLEREEKLYESEERFRQIAENIDAVLWIRNVRTGRLEFVSSGIDRLWGISTDELTNNHGFWSDYVHPDDRKLISEADQEKPLSGTVDREYRIITPDGRVRWVRDRVFPVKDKYGNVQRLVGFTIDTTERKQSEEIKANLLAREQAARAQAEAANRTKDEFLAIVSH
jgi:PAS domain S-box-containing protein